MAHSSRLTKAVKADIAGRAVKDLFASFLRKHWESAEVQLNDLVKESFADFDWAHVKPHRKFIHWHNEICLSSLPAEWEIQWDEFRRVCGLNSIFHISLSFEYPSKDERIGCLDYAYHKQVVDILRPYLIQYFTARKYYEDIQQVLLGLSTYKQLEETVPELAKYVPRTTTGTVTALVPIQQIDRIRGLLQKEAS
jgi:hypothetical protein